jgi:tetratricopeptide (TPR) repeat protein
MALLPKGALRLVACSSLICFPLLAQERIKVEKSFNPRDPWAHTNLGRVYILNQQSEKAVVELELAESIAPEDPSVALNLGRAYMKTNQTELAAKAFEKSTQLQPVPFRWNAVAYEMAVDKLDLPQAEKYAEDGIAATLLQMRDTSRGHLTREDSSNASRIASYWDTWGWIRFQKGDLPEAEKYVKCAWMIDPLSINSDHLGQIYEKQGRKAEAMCMYQMALAADSSASETRERFAALAGRDANVDKLVEEGHALLKESSTITIKNSHQAEGFAEFWILLAPGPAVRGIEFINGDDELSAFAKDLESVAFSNVLSGGHRVKALASGKTRVHALVAGMPPAADFVYPAFSKIA